MIMSNSSFHFKILSQDTFYLNLNYPINSSAILNFNSTGIKFIEILSENFYFNPFIYVSDLNFANKSALPNIEIFGIF